MSVVRPQVFDAHRGTEENSKLIEERSKDRSRVRRGEEEDAARCNGQAALRRVASIRRFAQHVLGQQTAQAVTDEQQGSLTKALVYQQIHYLARAVRQGHGVAAVSVAVAEPCQNAGQARWASSIAERPHGELRELRGNPAGPRVEVSLAMPPSAVRISAEAVDEHYVSHRILRPGISIHDAMEFAHSRSSVVGPRLDSTGAGAASRASALAGSTQYRRAAEDDELAIADSKALQSRNWRQLLSPTSGLPWADHEQQCGAPARAVPGARPQATDVASENLPRFFWPHILSRSRMSKAEELPNRASMLGAWWRVSRPWSRVSWGSTPSPFGSPPGNDGHHDRRRWAVVRPMQAALAGQGAADRARALYGKLAGAFDRGARVVTAVCRSYQNQLLSVCHAGMIEPSAGAQPCPSQSASPSTPASAPTSNPAMPSSANLRQVAEAKGWEVVAEYTDAGVSGSKRLQDRPKGSALMRDATRRTFDVVASWSVDRLGRSLQDLIGTLSELHAGGLDLYLHQQAIDTRTPAGRALFQMLGVFAEFERSIIVDRVKAGMAKAKAKGTKSGNPIGRPQVPSKVEDRIRALRADGLGMLKIAKTAGCGVSTVQRVLAEA